MENEHTDPLWKHLGRSVEIHAMTQEVIEKYLPLKRVIELQAMMLDNLRCKEIPKMFFNYESN